MRDRIVLIGILGLLGCAADKGAARDDSGGGGAESGDSGPPDSAAPHTGETAGETGESGETGAADPCAGTGEDALLRAEACAIVEAASALLEALDESQQAEIRFSMDDPERYEWDNRPIPSYPRVGLSFGEMDEAQKELAYTLVQVSMSASAWDKASGIILLDELARLRGDTQMGEDFYHFGVFGEPSMDAAWGWQFDGHHMAMSWTLSGAEVIMTPTFYGAQPTEVRDGDYAGLRVLGDLTDRALALMETLSEEQEAQVIVSDSAPGDLEVGPHMDGMFPETEIGINAGALSAEQQALLLDLVAAYAGSLPEAHAEQRLTEIAVDLDSTYFAWMGPVDTTALHYYRISGPTVWIEYDVIASIDHVHTIWRDPTNDYGEDLLAAHYARYDHGWSLRTRPIRFAPRE